MLVRRGPRNIAEGAEIAIGDLGDPDAVDRSVRGAEVVIHAGAAMRGGWIEHQCGTIAGTRNVLDACAKHRVRKVVHISSMSVVAWAGAGLDEPISEDSDLEPRAEDRGHYTRAKLEAEQLVRHATVSGRVPSVILRPGQIFGGGISVLTPAVARRMGSRWIVLGDGEVRLPLVHMDDVVDAVVRAADGPLCQGEVIQLIHPESLTQNQVLKLVAGEKVKVTRLPRPVVFALGALSEFALGLLKKKSPLSRYRLRSALSKRTFVGLRTGLLGKWAPSAPIRNQVMEHADCRSGRFISPNVTSTTPSSAVESAIA
jgi:nucleoside-diphosphate-sugar epimerase